MTGTMLTIAPVRGRRERAEQMLASFTETADFSDLVVVTDPDDQDTYNGMDWGPAATAVLDPRGSTIEKLNMVALECAGAYDAVYFVSDDQVFRTKGWDTIMMGVLTEDLGGYGWVYPEDHYRNDIPEHYLVSTDVIRVLGWYANPVLKHFYMADTVALLGRKTGLLRYCPQAVVEHLRYTNDPTVAHDETYRYAEREWGDRDRQAFMKWQADEMAYQAAKIRREFSPDVAWVLSKVAS